MNEQRLKQIKRQYDELQQRLQEPGSWQDPALFARLQRELQELSPVAEAYTEWEKTEQELSELEEMLSDPEMKEIAWEEKQALLKRREQQAVALRLLLLPKDPNDGKNVIMEIRAGVGGEEGALFASDLYRMYSLYAETRRWKLDIVNVSETELGGIKEISFVVEGENAFSRLKYEGGGHRVQRVPVTESGGRIHTSAATVAVLPQVEEVDFTAPAASTSTKPRAPSASPICPRARWWSARMSAASIKTRIGRCRLCVQSSMSVSRNDSMPNLRRNERARSAPGIEATVFAPIIFPRIG